MRNATRRWLALPILAVMMAALAPAPRGSIQYAGLVLKKLDATSPPSYPNEFFTDREALSKDVETVVRIMTDPARSEGWCGPITDILNLATGTNTYFDISQSVNPALDDFKKDWMRVMQYAGCR
jgi:hypothetical protein